MKIGKFILGGIMVALFSVFYNYFVFRIFNFFPEFTVFTGFSSEWIVFSVIFVKNFFVGIILMVLFYLGYANIMRDDDSGKYVAKGIFFFFLYGAFAFLSFSIGDLILFDSTEGLLILFTIDGLVESMILTVPVRFFALKL